MLLLAVLAPGLLYAATGTREQIERAVERHLTQAIASEARAQGWEGIRVRHSSTILNGTSHLAPCQQTLEVSRSDNKPPVFARQRLDVHCPAPSGWTVAVSAQVSVFLPVVFSSRAIERGQTINAQQLTLQELEISNAQRGFFHDIDDVTGMGAKRRIRANQLVSPALLTRPLLIRRGQQVKIIANHDGIEASALGEALENGQLKAIIRVKNLRSGKTIETKVLDVGIVTSTFR